MFTSVGLLQFQRLSELGDWYSDKIILLNVSRIVFGFGLWVFFFFFCSCFCLFVFSYF